MTQPPHNLHVAYSQFQCCGLLLAALRLLRCCVLLCCAVLEPDSSGGLFSVVILELCALRCLVAAVSRKSRGEAAEGRRKAWRKPCSWGFLHVISAALVWRNISQEAFFCWGPPASCRVPESHGALHRSGPRVPEPTRGAGTSGPSLLRLG